jgi:hypothetical protein
MEDEMGMACIAHVELNVCKILSESLAGRDQLHGLRGDRIILKCILWK